MNAIRTYGKGKLGVALLACFMFVFALALTACSGVGSAGAVLSEAVDSGTAMAMVKAVDGNTVTVEIMAGMDAQGVPGDENGQPPAMPEGDSAQPTDNSAAADAADTDAAQAEQGASGESNDQPPAMPEGDGAQNGFAGDGEQPPAMPDGNNGSEPPAMPDGEQPPAMPGESTAQASDDSATDASSDSSAADQTMDVDGSEPLAMPDNNGGTDGNEPPAMPEGDNGQGGMPGGTEATLTINDESIIVFMGEAGDEQAALSDITVGSMLQLTVGSDGTSVSEIVVMRGMGGAEGQGGPGGGVGSSTGNTGTGATTITSDTTEDGKTYASENADENALRIEGASATITNATITKSGDSSSSEDSDFYGLNAGILALDGSSLALEDATINTDSQGSNGVFAYGEETLVNVSDTTINTTQGNSGGIEVAGGATLNATNLTVDTQGQSSAAIRSDRGGGTEVVSGGSYTTHGNSSPAVYCTADVMVNSAQLTAENCEGVVIEGLNSVALNNCTLTANINDVATRTGISNGVMVYQSMSGDAQEGTGTFSMSGGTFTNTSSTLFYVTNTPAKITLDDVEIENSGDNVIIVSGNDGQWGKEGSNGGTVEFTAVDQDLDGIITVDEISSLTLKLTEDSDFEGAINSDGQAGEVNVELDVESEWEVTDDSSIT